MIFEFEFSGQGKEPLLISSIFPQPWVGLLISCGSAFLIVYFWNQLRRQQFQRLDVLALATSTIALLGVYIFSSRWVDEVYVNLEHPFNFLHHGRFSFSPLQMVDGTVEFAYYLLLTPFAFTQTTLIWGGLLLGFVVLWLHLFLLWKLLGKGHPTVKLLLLLGFSLALPLVYIFSNGFGNGLVSLLLMVCFYQQLRKRGTVKDQFHARQQRQFSGKQRGPAQLALQTAIVFPLLRPDAIFYSFSVLLVEAWREKKVPFLNLLASLGAVGIYLSGVRLFYGHWIPIPVSFKSFKLSMIPMVSWLDVTTKLTNWFWNPFHLVFVILLATSFWWVPSEKLRAFRLYVVPLTAIFFFYTFTTSTQFNFGIYDGRYFVGFELFAILFPLLLIWDWVGQGEAQPNIFPIAKAGSLDWWLTRPRENAIACLLIVSLYLGSVGLTYQATQPVPRLVTRTDRLAALGQIADSLIPKDWSFSTTELNSFGLMMPDREIIDLWGYTNPAIAHSKICNEMRVRNNPDFFLQTRPDIFWWWLRRNAAPEPEDMLQRVNLAKRFNQLGNMLEVMQQYDVFFLNHRQYDLTLFIRRELTRQFLAILGEKRYEIIESRPLDIIRYRQLYDSHQLIQHYCG